MHIRGQVIATTVPLVIVVQKVCGLQSRCEPIEKENKHVLHPGIDPRYRYYSTRNLATALTQLFVSCGLLLVLSCLLCICFWLTVCIVVVVLCVIVVG